MNNIRLTLDDSRRLTGKNLFMDQSGAVLDAFVSGVGKQKVADTWLKNLLSLLEGVGWGDTQCVYRIFEDGVSLGFAAPIDALYAATDINEAAWEMTSTSLLKEHNKSPDLSELINTLIDSIKTESNPKLLELINSAEENGIAYLVDDDGFSLGYGTTSKTWAINELPNIDSIDWTAHKTVPTALVTGTNGKSTSVRLSAHILKQAGVRCGVTSTDFIKVGDTILDKGDYSGPGGARMLLRHTQTEAAVLEVARGGLLRRGLPIPQVDVALVTNVAEDHLGQYGINSVEALTAAKMMVSKAAKKQLILNADDENIVHFVKNSYQNINQDINQEMTQQTLTRKMVGLNVSKIEQEPLAEYLPEKIVWFSLEETNPVIKAAREKSQNVCFLRDEKIVYATAENETTIIDIKNIPMTLNGAAVHNVQNALGAVALSKAFGVNDSDISEALSQFKSDAEDNPGRGNMFEYRGAKIILDFAHNVHSMDAMAKTLANIPAKRKILMLCHAGDRSDAEIQAMTSSSMAMQPDLVWVCELPNYLRGREFGDLPKVITASILESGLSADCIYYQDNLLKGADDIIQQLQQDDLVFMMALSDRDEIAALLSSAQSTESSSTDVMEK